IARDVDGMCTSSTSRPFFLNNPSSCATQVPLMLLANEVQATRAFICAFAGAASDKAQPTQRAIAILPARAVVFMARCISQERTAGRGACAACSKSPADIESPAPIGGG